VANPLKPERPVSRRLKNAVPCDAERLFIERIQPLFREQLRFLRLIFRIRYRSRIPRVLEIEQLLPKRGCLMPGRCAAAQF